MDQPDMNHASQQPHRIRRPSRPALVASMLWGLVGCPTLILHDRADAAVPIAHAEWALHCIPSAQFCELHAGGHLIWVGRDHDKLRSERAAFIRRHVNRPA